MCTPVHNAPLQIGDRIRISVALIRILDDMPGHESMEVQVVDIVPNLDGTKTLMLGYVAPTADV